jgi:hypothetical protein
MRIASLRRQQTLTGIPVDSEILRLDEPATKNAVLSRQSTEESARK